MGWTIFAIILLIGGNKTSDNRWYEKFVPVAASTLRSYIEAMGGELDIIARFPDGEVHITQKVYSSVNKISLITKRI